MNKDIYKKTMTRLIYAWLILFSLLIFGIVNISNLSTYLNEADKLRKEELGLVEFTYKTELVGHNLTNSVRLFTVVFDPEMLTSYWNELQKIRMADSYIVYLKNLHGSKDELQYILTAKKIADGIRENEIKSIKLILTAYEINPKIIPPEIEDYELSLTEKSLSPTEKIKLAQQLLKTKAYVEDKERIFFLFKKTRDAIVKRSQEQNQQMAKKIDFSMLYLKYTLYLALILVIIIVWIRALAIRKFLH